MHQTGEKCASFTRLGDVTTSSSTLAIYSDALTVVRNLLLKLSQDNVQTNTESVQCISTAYSKVCTV